jgi:hypothetical protein
VVETYLAEIRITPQQLAAYNPPPGFGMTVCEYKPALDPTQSSAVLLFCVSELQPESVLRKTAKDIQHEIQTTFRGRVLADKMPSHWNAPKRALILETALDHPHIAKAKDVPREVRRAAEGASDIHEIELTDDQLADIPAGPRGERLEAIERRPKMRKVTARARDGTVQTIDEVERHVNIIRVGVIDSA